MDRLEGAFVAVVFASVLLGGMVAVDASDSFRTVDLAGTVGPQVDAEVRSTAVRGERLVLAASLQNPTRYRLRLTGVFVQAFEDDSRLAYGSAPFADPIVIPARSTERVRYSVQLSAEGVRRLRAARADTEGVRVRTRYSLRLGETGFTVRNATRLGAPGGT